MRLTWRQFRGVWRPVLGLAVIVSVGWLGRARLPEFAEVRDFIALKISPGRFRDQCIRKFLLGEQELLLVGTIHSMHLTTPAYGLADVENVVRNYRPDSVALEIRPKDLEERKFNLGPIEMAQVAIATEHSHVPTFGFDVGDDEAMERAAERGVALDYNDDHRNREMVALLKKGSNGLRRVVAFTGYSHLEPFARLLKSAGAVEVPMSDGERHSLYADAGARSTLYPDMLASIRASAASLQDYLDHYGKENEWSERIRAKLAQLRTLETQLSSKDDAQSTALNR